MKKYIWLLAGLTLAGCGREDAHHAELMTKLTSLENRLASIETLSTNEPATLRWAYANKREIESVVFSWTQSKLDEARKAETLTPEIQEKLAHFNSLQGQLYRLRMPMPAMVRRPGELPPEPTAEEKEYAALSKRVAEAKEPVAEIVDQHNREMMDIREKYSVERLLSDYVKGRYDIVVDSDWNKVLYRSAGEVPDITEGVIKFFREKQK
jgi:hypothetical protein